jgi:hypothetical protein
VAGLQQAAGLIYQGLLIQSIWRAGYGTIFEALWCLHLDCLNSQSVLRLVHTSEVNYEKLEEFGSFCCYRRFGYCCHGTNRRQLGQWHWRYLEKRYWRMLARWHLDASNGCQRL